MHSIETYLLSAFEPTPPPAMCHSLQNTYYPNIPKIMLLLHITGVFLHLIGKYHLLLNPLTPAFSQMLTRGQNVVERKFFLLTSVFSVLKETECAKAFIMRSPKKLAARLSTLSTSFPFL